VVKQDNTVAVQNVTSLTTNETDTAVKGLDPNVKIATSGFDRLENGARRYRTPGQGQGQGKGKPTAKQPAPGQTQAPGQRPRPAGQHAPASRRNTAWKTAALPPPRATAGFGAAGGGLSDDPGHHLLPGRESDVVASAITAPLERQFGQVPGLNQMTSISSGGSVRSS
jgi:hypothetical protein